jgi:hypothetical protein
MERRKEFTLESLSTSEARAMSGLLRQASLEKIGYLFWIPLFQNSGVHESKIKSLQVYLYLLFQYLKIGINLLIKILALSGIYSRKLKYK